MTWRSTILLGALMLALWGLMIVWALSQSNKIGAPVKLCPWSWCSK